LAACGGGTGLRRGETFGSMTGFELLIAFVGHVALLLWGVRMVRTGITRSFLSEIRRTVALGTRNRVSAAAIGLGVTVLLQSSTAAGLIVSSLVAREIMTLSTALAVMLGADVGTTIAAFVFSIDVSWLSPLLVAAGVILFLASSGDRTRSLARIAIGLGLTLLSLRLLGTFSGELRNSPTFMGLLALLANQPLLAFLIAAVITWLAHSSLSMVILFMSLSASGIITLPLALALVLGANVGGCLAPFIDQLGATAQARRVALGNLLMRGLAALAVLALALPVSLRLLESVHAASAAHSVLIFHCAFNALVAVVFLPLVGWVAALCRRLLPDAPPSEDMAQPRYLDASVIESPTEALACATRETLRLGDIVTTMLEKSLDVLEKDDASELRSIEGMDDAVDRLHEAIKLYLMRISSAGMSHEDSRRFVEILSFVTNLEHIGDIIDKNLMELAGKKIRNKLSFSPEGRDELRQFHARVLDNMRLAFNVFTLRDLRLARKLLAEKPLLREAEVYTANSHFARLRARRPETIETSGLHLDIIRDLKRINSHLTSVAYPILEAAGELLESRLRPQGEVATPASLATRPH
jgi:phosphate:Na+ symporter